MTTTHFNLIVIHIAHGMFRHNIFVRTSRSLVISFPLLGFINITVKDEFENSCKNRISTQLDGDYCFREFVDIPVEAIYTKEDAVLIINAIKPSVLWVYSFYGQNI